MYHCCSVIHLTLLKCLETLPNIRCIWFNCLEQHVGAIPVYSTIDCAPLFFFHLFFFVRQKGIIEPKSFFPAADLGYGKKYQNSWGILGAFNVKSSLPSCLLSSSLTHSYSAPHPFIFHADSPLSSHFPPLFSAFSYCTDLAKQFLTWGYGCDHMLIFFYDAPVWLGVTLLCALTPQYESFKLQKN